MKHYMNKRSGKYLCEVKRPKFTANVTDVGQFLGRPESWCETCGRLRSTS